MYILSLIQTFSETFYVFLYFLVYLVGSCMLNFLCALTNCYYLCAFHVLLHTKRAYWAAHTIMFDGKPHDTGSSHHNYNKLWHASVPWWINRRHVCRPHYVVSHSSCSFGQRDCIQAGLQQCKQHRQHGRRQYH